MNNNLIQFIIKKNDSFQHFIISDEQLNYFYDVDLFNDTENSISKFISLSKKNDLEINYEKPLIDELYKYQSFIIMDFDKKTILDYQDIRILNQLFTYDNPKIFASFQSQGWLGEGLLDYSNLETIIPFNEQSAYELLKENSKGDFEDPVIMITPNDWTFNSLYFEIDFDDIEENNASIHQELEAYFSN